MEHVEDYLKNHTPKKHDFLNYIYRIIKLRENFLFYLMKILFFRTSTLYEQAYHINPYYTEPGKPSGFECTFEEGLCTGWSIVERGIIKDPRTNITENVGQWMVLQGSSISLLTGPLFDHTRKDHLGRYLLAQGSGNTPLTKFYFKTPPVRSYHIFHNLFSNLEKFHKSLEVSILF